MAVVRALYFTDPACPRSWAAEPALRRLEATFGPELELRPIMCGLWRTFERPLELLAAWLDAAADSAMPVDARLWLDAPPSSSHPACMAVIAAREQNLDRVLLRRARESFAVDCRRLDSPDALLELARGVPGLRLERYRIDLSSHALLEAFSVDLERARAGGTAGTPRLEVDGRGSDDPERWHDLLLGAGATPGEVRPQAEQALHRWGRMAAAEVAAACDLPLPRAQAELWRLVGELRVNATALPGGGAMFAAA